MEYLNDSCDEKPRSAPVPASFSGGPIVPGVPEVSLVFSPSPTRRVNSTHTPKACISKTPFTNEINQVKNLNVHQSKEAEVFDLSPLSVHNRARTSENVEIQKPPISQNGVRNLESVSMLANRIIRENEEQERKRSLQRNTNFERGTSVQRNLKMCVNSGMAPNVSENLREQLQMTGSYVSENAERVRKTCPGTYVNKPFSNLSDQLGCIQDHLARTNINMQRINQQPNVIPCSNMSHRINKQCFCGKNCLVQSDTRVSVPNNITLPDHPCLSNGYNLPCSNSSEDSNFSLNHALPHSSAAPSGNSHPNAVQCGSCSSLFSGSKRNKSCDSHQSYGNNSMNYYVSPNPVPNTSEACSNCVGFIHNDVVKEKEKHDDDFTKIKNPESGKGHFQKGLNKGTSSTKSSGLKAIDEEKINDNCSSGNSLLQKLVLMNEQQFTVLQGLLQQVVTMQGEQMKVLEEINKNLMQHHHSDECLMKDTAHPDKYGKNAVTQTSFIENTGNLSEDEQISKEDGPIPREDPSKDSENSNDSSPKRRSPSPSMMLTPDKEKSKNVHDKAVSWSAIHGLESVEESITLHSIHVPTVEQMPSSVHTMHLHLQDYHSSASFESITENKHSSESRFSESSLDNKKSWTLYDNIVGHVKKFLQAVPCENNCGNVTQKTPQVEAIRFATIEKIRQLGVSVYENSTEIKEVNTIGRIHFDPNLPHCQSPESSPFNAENNFDDASLELQALARKYLTADELCDLAKWNQGGRTNPILKAGQPSNNVSLATQNYLEKYHLLPSFAEIKDKRQMCGDHSPVAFGGNILDITTLKKQPKLL